MKIQTYIQVPQVTIQSTHALWFSRSGTQTEERQQATATEDDLHIGTDPETRDGIPPQRVHLQVSPCVVLSGVVRFHMQTQSTG